MAALNNVITYSGNGQQGVWTDPANWTGGKIPGPTSSALITKSAVLNGPIEVSNLMLLGQENVAINGAVKTDSTNTCESFMVCEGAVATLNAGAELNSAGRFHLRHRQCWNNDDCWGGRRQSGGGFKHRRYENRTVRRRYWNG